MELTNEEKQIVINVLSQVAVPVREAPLVLAIIEKLNAQVLAPSTDGASTKA